MDDEELEAALSILNQKTALMIRCVFYQGQGHKRTAKIFNCSRQAVNERIKKRVYQIIHLKNREKLESFMWNGYHVDPRCLRDYVDMEEIDNIGSEFLLLAPASLIRMWRRKASRPAGES